MEPLPILPDGQKNTTFARSRPQLENPFARLIPEQSIAHIPSFQLESGVTLNNVPLAYSTRGKLSPNGDNAMVICHALTGSADVSDWWGPLLGGPGRAFDVSRFFVVCVNSLGSPYGSASPVTCRDGNPDNPRYGPEFPLTTIRDDVNISKILLDELGVKQIAAVIGGSMGGMLVLEWAFFGSEYVRSIVAIATSARHSAWCISWGEAQRQSIYADPKYDDGYYSFDDPPAAGLGAARMSALLTYRSRNSFESRFGRAIPNIVKEKTIGDNQKGETSSDSHWAIHNDGHKTSRTSPSRKGVKNRTETTPPSSDTDAVDSAVNSQPQTPITDKQAASSANSSPVAKTSASTYFSAQSYLRYQADKFVKRFDSNCYIAITRKLDTHDVSRHRVAADDPNPIATALGQLKQPALVLGIESDGLFTFGEQQELAASMPNARLRRIESPEGHDAFLLQFEQVNRHILDFLHDALPDVMGKPGMEGFEQELGVGVMTKNSTFGEAEVEDLTAW